MDKEIILKALKAAMQSWIRSASPAQLWRVHQKGGLGAIVEVDGDDVKKYEPVKICEPVLCCTEKNPIQKHPT